MRLKFVHMLLLSSLIMLMSACDSTDDEVVAGDTQISITLSGDQVVPMQTTDATATASLTVDKDNLLTGSVTVTGLAANDTVSNIHLHLGNPGASGTSIFTLEQDTTDATIWNVPANSIFSATQLAAYLAGGTYLNVHTTAAPAGELRGQVLPENYEMIITTLSGDQQLTPVTTTMTGKAYHLINTSTGKLISNLIVSDGASANSAHIHSGNPGIATASPVVAYEKNASDATLFELTTDLSSADLTTFMAGGLYVNVHTDANPAGELRGQILPSGYQVVVTDLSGDQVVPTAITSTLTARGFSLVNIAASSMKVNVIISDASDVSAVHVHMGAIGASGMVVKALTVNANDANLYEANITLNDMDKTAFAAGELYFNVHTNTHGDGELRGQIQP